MFLKTSAWAISPAFFTIINFTTKLYVTSKLTCNWPTEIIWSWQLGAKPHIRFEVNILKINLIIYAWLRMLSTNYLQDWTMFNVSHLTLFLKRNLYYETENSKYFRKYLKIIHKNSNYLSCWYVCLWSIMYCQRTRAFAAHRLLKIQINTKLLLTSVVCCIMGTRYWLEVVSHVIYTGRLCVMLYDKLCKGLMVYRQRECLL